MDSTSAKDYDTDKEIVVESSDTEKQSQRTIDPRERLSAYFTIAAAAAGLISDGCQYPPL